MIQYWIGFDIIFNSLYFQKTQLLSTNKMCCKIEKSTYIAAKHSVATSIKALVGRHVTHIWRSSLRDEVEDNPHWWAYLQLMCPSNSKDHFEKKFHIF